MTLVERAEGVLRKVLKMLLIATFAALVASGISLAVFVFNAVL